LGSDLDQIQVELAGACESFWQRLYPDLLTVSTDEANLAGTDPVVDPGLVVSRRSYRRSLLMDAQAPPYAWLMMVSWPCPPHSSYRPFDRQNNEADVGEADIRVRGHLPAAFA
jgi:hypothetical protein